MRIRAGASPFYACENCLNTDLTALILAVSEISTIFAKIRFAKVGYFCATIKAVKLCHLTKTQSSGICIWTRCSRTGITIIPVQNFMRSAMRGSVVTVILKSANEPLNLILSTWGFLLSLWRLTRALQLMGSVSSVTRIRRDPSSRSRYLMMKSTCFQKP